jgi:hypothetical protein
VLASVSKGRSGFAALAGSVLISTTALATNIDFSGIPGSQDSPFTSYTESGFTVAPLSGSWLIGQNIGHPRPFILFGHPAIGGTTTKAAITVTDAGATFRFNAIDIYSSVTPVPYVFTGLVNGQTVFTASGTVPLPYGKFSTVPNPHGTDLIDTLQVTLSTFTQFPVANRVGIDNIVVTAANSRVPEPTGILIAGLLLVGSALAVVALVRRRSSNSEKS